MKEMFEVGRHKDQIAEKEMQFTEAVKNLIDVDKKLLYKILRNELSIGDL